MQPEPREFEPKGHKWEVLFCSIALILFTTCLIGYWWIESHPPKPPPHVSRYDNPTPKLTFTHGAEIFVNMDGTDVLYGLAIEMNSPDKHVYESAIYVGEGWDCVLATEKDGCIIK